MPRLPEGVLVAVIAATSALAGTLVGAIVSYEGNQQLQDRQVHREESHETTAARAIARVLMSEFIADERSLTYMTDADEYDSHSYDQHKFVSKVSEDDRKLLAGRLPESSWTALSKGDRAVQAVEAALEEHHGRGLVDADERTTLKQAEADCRQAVAALTPLAEGT
jgi:hypothetical protein